MTLAVSVGRGDAAGLGWAARLLPAGGGWGRGL